MLGRCFSSQVTGTAGGVAVTLHSLAEAGSTSGVDTTAVANLTPLTEIIVAHLSASLPADLFAAFGSGEPITREQLAAATTEVLAALKTATGIDLGSIDPFKTQLVAATPAAPTQGNAYDRLLDQLGDKVGPEALPQVVNQVAAAKAAGSSAGLGDAMEAVDGGSLAGCPAALSGKYRTIDYTGRTAVRQIDFAAMKFNTASGQPLFDITADASKPCEFTVAGTADGKAYELSFVMGPQGAGAYYAENVTDARSTVGYIFPVQSHKLEAMAGTWTFLQSGVLPGDGINHFPGQFTLKADGSVETCDYDPFSWAACEPAEDNANLKAALGTDGGVNLVEGSSNVVANFYGYRAPNGSLNWFGTTNPTGASGPTVEATDLVGTRLQKLALPKLGDVTKYWDLQFSVYLDNPPQIFMPHADSTTITGFSGDFVLRTRSSDGRKDMVRYNHPIDGLRKREAGVWDNVPFAPVVQFPFTGLVMTVSINAQPQPANAHIYAISVLRP